MACCIEGCANTVSTRSMCEKHYTRWRRHGNASTVKSYPHRTIAKQKTGVSYVMIRVDGSYKAEHVLMAEKAIDRALPEGAIVHHVDRDGTNNNTKSPWNLVVCPDQTYHLLLHTRARALGYEPMRAGDKLTAREVVEIKASREPRSVLATRYAVSVHNIKAIRAGKRDDAGQAIVQAGGRHS